jgi:hypothetical protein
MFIGADVFNILVFWNIDTCLQQCHIRAVKVLVLLHTA